MELFVLHDIPDDGRIVAVVALAFSPDGKRLISGSGDGICGCSQGTREQVLRSSAA